MTDPRPDRLIHEAKRNIRRLEFATVMEGATLGTALAKWGRGGWTEPTLIAAVLGAVVAMLATEMLRVRQRDRCRWLEETPRWWERMEEMPRVEPFPKVVDFVELRLIAPARDTVARLFKGRGGSRT